MQELTQFAVNDIRGLVSQLKNRGLGVIITDHNVRETLGITEEIWLCFTRWKNPETRLQPKKSPKDEMVKKALPGRRFCYVKNPASPGFIYISRSRTR